MSSLLLNPQQKIASFSPNFTWHEALYLPSWQIYHQPSFEEIDLIEKMAFKMQVLRDLVAKPITVNCWIRPNKVNCEGSKHHGKNYNALVGGATKSAHVFGSAVDFTVVGLTVDEAQGIIFEKINDLELSFEQNGSAYGRNWLHAQDKKVRG